MDSGMMTKRVAVMGRFGHLSGRQSKPTTRFCHQQRNCDDGEAIKRHAATHIIHDFSAMPPTGWEAASVWEERYRRQLLRQVCRAGALQEEAMRARCRMPNAERCGVGLRRFLTILSNVHSIFLVSNYHSNAT